MIQRHNTCIVTGTTTSLSIARWLFVMFLGSIWCKCFLYGWWAPRGRTQWFQKEGRRSERRMSYQIKRVEGRPDTCKKWNRALKNVEISCVCRIVVHCAKYHMNSSIITSIDVAKFNWMNATLLSCCLIQKAVIEKSFQGLPVQL